MLGPLEQYNNFIQYVLSLSDKHKLSNEISFCFPHCSRLHKYFAEYHLKSVSRYYMPQLDTTTISRH